jgi:CRP/FNR family transcriptional regulator
MKKYCVNCIYETLPHDVVTRPAGTMLFQEGEPLEYVYRVFEGLVKINRLHPSGDEKIFDVLQAGDYIALIAVLQGKNTYIASAETLVPTRLIRIATPDVIDAYESNEIFKRTCLNCAVTRSTLFQSKLFQMTNIDTEEKILAIFQLLAEKFGTIENGRVRLDLPFNKTVLADLIGIRRETLSRKLSSMQADNLLDMDKNTYYFDRM